MKLSELIEEIEILKSDIGDVEIDPIDSENIQYVLNVYEDLAKQR